jgi:hypothetical protein
MRPERDAAWPGPFRPTNTGILELSGRFLLSYNLFDIILFLPNCRNKSMGVCLDNNLFSPSLRSGENRGGKR